MRNCKYRNKFHLHKLGPAVLNGLNSSSLYMVLRLVVCSVLFSFIRRSIRQVTVCSLNSRISPASKNLSPVHGESAKSFKSRWVSYVFPSSLVLRCVSYGKGFWKFSVLGNLTCAQELRWLRVFFFLAPLSPLTIKVDPSNSGSWLCRGNQICQGICAENISPALSVGYNKSLSGSWLRAQIIQ